MIKLNKILYYVLAAICIIVALGVVISRIVTKTAFEVEDCMLLITTVAGWVFAKSDDNGKSGGSSDGDDESDSSK